MTQATGKFIPMRHVHLCPAKKLLQASWYVWLGVGVSQLLEWLFQVLEEGILKSPRTTFSVAAHPAELSWPHKMMIEALEKFRLETVWHFVVWLWWGPQ